MSLVELCAKEGQISIIEKNVENVEKVSSEWTLSKDEKRELFKFCANSLDKSHNFRGAYGTTLAYLKQF